MNTEQEMRCCPFCGTSNKLKVTPYRADDDGGEPFDWGFTVICSALGFSHAPNRGCGASGAWGETEAEAIAAWNRRDEQAPDATQSEAVPAQQSGQRTVDDGGHAVDRTLPVGVASPPAVAAGGVTEALRNTTQWLEAALNCKNWHWDWDQRVVASADLDAAKAALAAVGDAGIREGDDGH